MTPVSHDRRRLGLTGQASRCHLNVQPDAITAKQENSTPSDQPPPKINLPFLLAAYNCILRHIGAYRS
ncbi:MAG: hypothetical protein LC808_35575 [Actinobacteria bacterium]|nr:hypothetical protein [Actinomycetota bacterium]